MPGPDPCPRLGIVKNAVLYRSHPLRRRLYDPEARAELAILPKEGNFSPITF